MYYINLYIFFHFFVINSLVIRQYKFAHLHIGHLHILFCLPSLVSPRWNQVSRARNQDHFYQYHFFICTSAHQSFANSFYCLAKYN